MSRREWLLSIIGWDAGLPLAVAGSFFVLPELVAVLVIPPLAAIFRAHHGYRQFASRGIEATPSRQILFGCALVVLLFFEIMSGILHFGQGVPPAAWLVALAIYLAYLALVALALRPRRWAAVRLVDFRYDR